MKRYKKYKPSGIEWVGEIPEHWEEKKIKYFANLTLGKMLTSEDKGGYFLKPYLRAQNINWFKVDITDLKEMWFSQKELEKYRLSLNDILVSEGGEVGRTCIWQNEIDECYIQNSVHKISFKRNYNPRFFLYLFYYLGQKGYFASIVNQISIGHLTGEKLKEIFLIYPSADEQTYISNYLDRRAAQIDDLIAKKQKLIDLLNEEKTAIINQAVTKGLDPNTPMKDIGTPWLGERPAHWEVRKLKYVSKINPEALTENTKEDFRFFYIDISSVDSEGNITDLIELLFKDAPSRARRIVKREDTIISTVRTYLKAIAFIQREDRNLICSTGFSVIRPDPKVFRPKFLFYLLRSDKIINAISSLSKGVSYPAIDSEDLAEIATWFPPREEQDAILNYIEANKNRIDKTISKINKEIGLLQEYRTALISEAVTGKIDVRI